MFFTRIGKYFAYLLLAYGIVQVGLALSYGVSLGETLDGREAIFGHVTEEMSKGITRIFFAISLGVICEISSKQMKSD